jgi:hypothetical protein
VAASLATAPTGHGGPETHHAAPRTSPIRVAPAARAYTAAREPALGPGHLTPRPMDRRLSATRTTPYRPDHRAERNVAADDSVHA